MARKEAVVKEPARLEDTVAKINKMFGANTLIRLGGQQVVAGIQVIPTQSLALNRALGIGGIPRGRITEISGPEHGGKTGICLGVVAEAQAMGLKAAYIDPECALDPDYANLLDVNLEELLYSQPESGEDALNIVEALVRTGEVGCIVIDSVAALVPKAELEGEMGDPHIGLQARLMGQAMRKLTGLIAKHGVAVVFINQIREKIGVMFGSPETTPGGRALRFFASLRLEVRKGEPVKKGDETIGHVLKCKVVKSKVSVPFKQCEFTVLYGKGVDRINELVALAVQDRIVHRAGSWLSVRDGDAVVTFDSVEARANSRDNFAQLVAQSPSLFQYLKERVSANSIVSRMIVDDGPVSGGSVEETK